MTENDFKVGNTAWAIRERDRGEWMSPMVISITDIERDCIIGKSIAGLHYTFEHTLVFATHQEAPIIFDKIKEQIRTKEEADKEIRRIAYGR
jgi:hypothetical protein